MITVTPELKRQIRQAVRDNISGASPLIEVGIRDDMVHEVRRVTNTLLWGDWDDNQDLDFVPLKYLNQIEEVPGLEGRAMLDLYVTSGHGQHRELETNVAVVIVGGTVIAASSDSREIEKLEALARTTTL